MAGSSSIGMACFNTSGCPYPMRCVVEAPYRRYCAQDTQLLSMFTRPIGGHSCQRCSAPLLLSDFSPGTEMGAYQCDSACLLPLLATSVALQSST